MIENAEKFKEMSLLNVFSARGTSFKAGLRNKPNLTNGEINDIHLSWVNFANDIAKGMHLNTLFDDNKTIFIRVPEKSSPFQNNCELDQYISDKERYSLSLKTKSVEVKSVRQLLSLDPSWILLDPNWSKLTFLPSMTVESILSNDEPEKYRIYEMNFPFEMILDDTDTITVKLNTDMFDDERNLLIKMNINLRTWKLGSIMLNFINCTLYHNLQIKQDLLGKDVLNDEELDSWYLEKFKQNLKELVENSLEP